ncbi:alpha/beta hydrolase [Agromyces archimandritae]|uniref:Alpha/beta hydrolase n=1 Tax=Agromyces archimandritae TaxID=2781962 RepID=A0A975IPZ1_9MICO|nr:alpha/beta hydrolase [Agromyces archimandritae]
MGDIDWHVFAPGTERTTVDAPSGPLAHVAAGPADGPRVLLIPGATGSKEDFVLMMPVFVAAGYRVESYDLAGQYESDGAGPEHLVPPRERYDEQLFLDDLFAVLGRGSAPAHVLGYSFAGTLAQLAMVSRPELFASLTLLSAPPEPGQAFHGVKIIGPVSDLAPAKVGAGLMIWGIRRNFNRVRPGRIAFVRERFARTRRASVDDIIGLMMETPDLREAVRAVPVPKLVAVGEHDLWPIESHAAFATAIGADLAVYPTGHSPCETTPHQLTRDMLALFVRSGYTA